MRTIKFRAFDDGKMIYENNILHLNNEDNLVLRLAKFWCNIRNDSHVMQFTGLHDKNGKEIYEGDIVKGAGVTSYNKPVIRRVAFDDASARFGLSDVNGNITFEPLKWISFPLEIIGNIYENSELISKTPTHEL